MYLGLAIPFSAVADFFFYWRTDLIFSKEKLDLVSVEKITLKKKKPHTNKASWVQGRIAMCYHKLVTFISQSNVWLLHYLSIQK